MDVDLSRLREMHARLPADLAIIMVVRAALALQRNSHDPGVSLSLLIQNGASAVLLTWPAADLAMLDQHDQNRITEDGAEAVILALVHRQQAWRVVRRMQREERADWLLETGFEGARQVVALEISGVDRGSVTARLSEKLDQVARSCDVDQRWAGVVGFQEPCAVLKSSVRQ